MTAETENAATKETAPRRIWDQAPTTPEPKADGTIVIVDIGDDDPDYEVIFRDDKRATWYDGDTAERWFDDPEDDGMTWQARLKYARAVYVVSASARVEVARDTTP